MTGSTSALARPLVPVQRCNGRRCISSLPLDLEEQLPPAPPDPLGREVDAIHDSFVIQRVGGGSQRLVRQRVLIDPVDQLLGLEQKKTGYQPGRTRSSAKFDLIFSIASFIPSNAFSSLGPRSLAPAPLPLSDADDDPSSDGVNVDSAKGDWSIEDVFAVGFSSEAVRVDSASGEESREEVSDFLDVEEVEEVEEEEEDPGKARVMIEARPSES